jgi:hypothetical protein
MIKVAVVVLLMLALAGLAGAQTAQNPDPSKWMCRSLTGSGGFLYEGETIFGSQACRPIQQAPAQSQPVASTVAAPGQAQPASASSSHAATAPSAQQPDSTAQQSAQNPPLANREQPRVFLQSASHGNTWNSRRDQSMEMSNDFAKVCTGVRITVNQQAADYTVLLNHIELGLFARDNQMQVADKNSDLLETKEGGGIKGGVKRDAT